MIADTPEELHAFAKEIGLRREWFQPHSVLDHYDLTARRRKLAVEHGAVEVSMSWLKDRIRKKRESEISSRAGVDPDGRPGQAAPGDDHPD
jgi:hypothetical protein